MPPERELGPACLPLRGEFWASLLHCLDLLGQCLEFPLFYLSPQWLLSPWQLQLSICYDGKANAPGARSNWSHPLLSQKKKAVS